MYGNFPNPYNNPYAAMQNRLATMEQQCQQYNSQPVPLNGRVVTGIEEARAAQIALNGTPSYFPSPAENKIYVKAVDMNGLPMFLTYKLEVPMQDNGADIETRLTNLENRMKELEKNGSDAINANA